MLLKKEGKEHERERIKRKEMNRKIEI